MDKIIIGKDKLPLLKTRLRDFIFANLPSLVTNSQLHKFILNRIVKGDSKRCMRIMKRLIYLMHNNANGYSIDDIVETIIMYTTMVIDKYPKKVLMKHYPSNKLMTSWD